MVALLQVLGLKGLLQREVVEGLLQGDERAEALDVGRRRLQELGRAVGVAHDRHRQLVDERALVLAVVDEADVVARDGGCLLYTSPSPRDS